MATTRLQALTAGRSIVCQEKDRDRYGRTVAICRASGEDLGAIMMREGLAWAFVRYSYDYVDQQEEARAANRGVPRTIVSRRGSGGRSNDVDRIPLSQGIDAPPMHTVAAWGAELGINSSTFPCRGVLPRMN